MDLVSLRDHPVVIAAADEMARGIWNPPTEMLVARCSTMLRDLSLPASRDFWTRWLIDRRVAETCANVRAMHTDAAEWLLTEPFMVSARRTTADLVHPLRDDPPALTTAILAALSESR